jgi:DMSO reductase anchor subunit
MSREILAFGAFAGLAALYAASYWAPIMLQWLGQPVPASLTDRALRDVIGAGAVVTGVFGVVCSVLIYSDTRRELWRGSRTVFRFFSTSVILGSATIIASSLAAALWLGLAATQEIGDIGRRLGVLLIVVTTLELAVDVSIFRHRFARRHTALKRTALLMGGELKRITSGRFGLGLLGGIVLPGIVLASSASRDGEAGATLVVALVSLALLVAAELCERHLFFSAVVAPKMPGAPVS